MQEQLADKKKMILFGSVAAVVIIVAAVILFFNKKEDSYRSILVYELEGSAEIERQDVGTMAAAENLYLESGDRITVSEGSTMRMKLDDDKYVTAEENTVFSVVAEGDSKDSKTTISLEQGAITNEIQNRLSEDSEFETSTPNSVMAVRGTIYRVELYLDENNEQNTKVCTFDGTVGATPILPDGTKGEEIAVEAGKELNVDADGTVTGPTAIAFEELPEEALEVLNKLLESGAPVKGITKESLDGLIAAQAEPAAIEEEPVKAETAKEENDTKEQPAEEKATSADTKTAEEKPQQTEKAPAAPVVPAAETPVVQAPEETPVVEPAAPEEKEEEKDDDSDSKKSHHSSDKKPSEQKPSEQKPEKPDAWGYTVTYKYGNETFATQWIAPGKTASKPVLQPTENGEWCLNGSEFDFTTPIEGNTELVWSQGG